MLKQKTKMIFRTENKTEAELVEQAHSRVAIKVFFNHIDSLKHRAHSIFKDEEKKMKRE